MPEWICARFAADGALVNGAEINIATAGDLGPWLLCSPKCESQAEAVLAQYRHLSKGDSKMENQVQHDLVHLVNLGGWLVMELWMTPADSGGLPDTYSTSEFPSRIGVAQVFVR